MFLDNPINLHIKVINDDIKILEIFHNLVCLEPVIGRCDVLSFRLLHVINKFMIKFN